MTTRIKEQQDVVFADIDGFELTVKNKSSFSANLNHCIDGYIVKDASEEFFKKFSVVLLSIHDNFIQHPNYLREIEITLYKVEKEIFKNPEILLHKILYINVERGFITSDEFELALKNLLKKPNKKFNFKAPIEYGTGFYRF